MISVKSLLMRLDDLNPLPLGYTSTPLDPLPRLSAYLEGPELWVKRDDQTGIATGGNKVRKLQFLLAEALRKQADVVITAGAAQSNHVRQTAALAAQLGLSCVLILKGTPPQRTIQGNYLLDRILGAEVRWSGDKSFTELFEEETNTLRAWGHNPYIVPFGGSNALGVCGYVAAMVELYQQMQTQNVHFDVIVLASGSGGTQAGLLLGAHALGYDGSIQGISVFDKAVTLREEIARLSTASAQLLHLECVFAAEEVAVNDAYLGGGYGVLGDLERKAITLAGRTEGLLVDPVYTGRALGGIIDMIQKSVLLKGQRVLFWHTGGIPALFAYGEDILK
jgi:L-cysteate sulfo-lyase